MTQAHSPNPLLLAARELDLREKRQIFFPLEATLDASWNMLLYLFAHQYKPISVGDACRVSGAPRATALRYMKSLSILELIEKDEIAGFQNVKRVRLTELGRNAMQSYLKSISSSYSNP